MIRTWFTLLVLGVACFFGYRLGEKVEMDSAALSSSDLSVLAKAVPLKEEKPFAIVVYSYKNWEGSERALRSIFEQEYEQFRVIFFDDHSEDGTFEKVQSFVLENHEEHRVIVMQNNQRLGPVACLYRAAGSLLDHEIVIPLEAKDWLAHPSVLARLNSYFEQTDTWAVAPGAVFYPSYEQALYPKNKEEIPSWAPLCFYSALFKQIRLADLMEEGKFLFAKGAYRKPLWALAGSACRKASEPLFVVNQAQCRNEPVEKPSSTYKPVSCLHTNQPKEAKADLILFSCDRPLQLYACLESIDRYMSGLKTIQVLCRASSKSYFEAYRKVASDFPNARFVFQGKDPKRDFKPLLLKMMFGSPSEYVLFGTDDDVVKDFVDLETCIRSMVAAKAYGFYLRLGSHITYSYQAGKNQTVPPSVDLGGGVFAWNLKKGDSDWGFPHTVDMTLYRKSSLKSSFETLRYKTPNSLEFCWAKEPISEKEAGLYFERSKVLNIPLNVVSRTGNPHMNYLSSDELLTKFEEGLKMDIDPLDQIDNTSPHFEHVPQFILR